MNHSPWIPRLLLLVVFWVVALLAMSRLGWSSLAEFYRADRPFVGKRWHFIRIRVGRIRWSGSLTVGANHEGLFLAPMAPYRIAHPPLFIPWPEVSVEWRRADLLPVQLIARRAPRVLILVTESRAREMALAAGTAWPAPGILREMEIRLAAVSRGRTAAAQMAIALSVFAVSVIGMGVSNVTKYWSLERGGEVTSARIISVEPEDHDQVWYAYGVLGDRHAGSGSIDDAGPAPPRVGGELRIHYLPADPAVSCLGDPHVQLVNELASAGAAGALLACGVVLFLRHLGFVVRRPRSSARP